jgi:hypothetical protein
MKTINFIFAIIFLAFAFMQVDGTQPVAGILTFGTMAVICILAMFKVYSKGLLFAMLLSVVYYMSTVHTAAMEWVHSGAIGNHEEALTFFQLAFAILVLVFQGFRSFRKA